MNPKNQIMKKILSLALGILLISACTTGNVDTTEQTKYNLYSCDVPQEILDISPNNEVPWDCTWEASYNNGRVTFIKDDNGELLALVRTTPDFSSAEYVNDSLIISTP